MSYVEGSGSLTNGSGSGSPKNMRTLRIRIRNTGRIIYLGRPEKLTGLWGRLNLVQADSDATSKYDADTDHSSNKSAQNRKLTQTETKRNPLSAC
jgi:hypothetical protein